MLALLAELASQHSLAVLRVGSKQWDHVVKIEPTQDQPRGFLRTDPKQISTVAIGNLEQNRSLWLSSY